MLHVAHHALPHIGGLETVVAAETTRLAARGWGVAWSAAPGHGPRRHPRRGRRAHRPHAGWSGLEARFGVPFPLFSPWLLVVLRREVRRADLVHVHDALYLTSWVAALWCRLLRTPYVVHRHVGFVHHSSLVVRLVQRLVLGSVARLVLGGAAAILPIDEFVAAELRGETVTRPGAGRACSATGSTRLGSDPRRRASGTPSAASSACPSDLPLLLFVGRFVPKKGFPVVAAAAGRRLPDRLRRRRPARRASTTTAAASSSARCPPQEMPAVYGCVDVLVVASVGECPLTVLEAMSSGLPVLVNDDPALHSPWTAGPGRAVRRHGRRRAAPRRSATLVADPVAMRALGARRHGPSCSAEFSWDVHTRPPRGDLPLRCSRPQLRTWNRVPVTCS